MDNGTLSASDVALLSGGGGLGGGLGGGGAIIFVIAIIILFMFMGNGGNNNNNLDQDINRGFDSQNLQAQTRDILGAVTNGTAQTIAASTQNATNAINAIKDGNAALIREFGNVETALTALDGNMRNCCCDVKQLIQATSSATDALVAQSKYDTSMQMAQMEARLTAKMDANEIQNLRDQVSQLQLAQATNGMLRFPNQWAYGAGPFPPIFGGCCGNNV